MLVYGSGDLIIKARPAAAGSKFICRSVERLIALTADIGAGHLIVIVFTRKGALSAFVEDHTGFVRR